MVVPKTCVPHSLYLSAEGFYTLQLRLCPYVTQYIEMHRYGLIWCESVQQFWTEIFFQFSAPKPNLKQVCGSTNMVISSSYVILVKTKLQKQQLRGMLSPYNNLKESAPHSAGTVFCRINVTAVINAPLTFDFTWSYLIND